MKKSVLLGFMLVCAIGLAQAQDTIGDMYGKLPGYHYTYWFENCDYFNNDSGSCIMSQFCSAVSNYQSSGCVKTRWDSVAHPTAITGIGVMDSSMDLTDLRRPTAPEYVYIYQYVGNWDTVLLLDSVRWDTASFRILRMPWHRDTSIRPVLYFRFYEVNLSKPVVVDSVFLLGGSCNSNTGNTNTQNVTYHHLCGWTPETPSLWCGNRVYSPNVYRQGVVSHTTPHHLLRLEEYGPFFIKVDEVQVDLFTADSLKGTTSPGGRYSKYVEQRLYAYPRPGYRFTHWHDGDTNNPRRIVLTQDTAFTAYFDTNETYIVHVQGTYGSVTGGGPHWAHDTVTLTAVPEPHYRFVQWNDGDRNNPRRFVITCDTIFTASFERIPTYRITAEPIDPDMGYVTGMGTFEEGEEVRLTAVAWQRYPWYRFSCWNDSVMDNPRCFAAMSDSSFTAIFVAQTGVEQAEGAAFSMAPNPAQGYVTITSLEQGRVLITFYDVAGHAVLSQEAHGEETRISTQDLPSGTYFVTLTSPRGTSSQKLVIEHVK